jgi:hypothetical protein
MDEAVRAARNFCLTLKYLHPAWSSLICVCKIQSDFLGEPVHAWMEAREMSGRSAIQLHHNTSVIVTLKFVAREQQA